MEEHDISIIGGSMAGFLAGISACENGIYPTIFEEHDKVGKFGKCTGVMSLNGMKSFNIDYKKCVSNYVNGAFIYFDDSEIKVEAKQDVASILYRQELDELLADIAVQKGCQIKTEEKFSKGIQENEKIKFKTNKGEYSTNYLIGCDGANSSVSANFDFPKLGKYDYAICNEIEITNITPRDKKKVEVFLDNQVLKGFFGWSVPVNEETMRIGFGVTDPLLFAESKKKFFEFKQIKPHLEKGKTLREFSYVIPINVRSQTQKQKIFLAGDSAGQVKATTGGGVIFGGNCAKIAGKVAALKTDDYELQWRKKYGSMLNTHRTIRKMLDFPNNFFLNFGLTGFKLLGGSFWLSHFGDMDFITNKTRIEVN
ncbi:Digeranylgeranylglycerophospholipid reductase [uncultured archaeon]|nr:Digeranylgeranylglycerophospholipid reductase [uncultured archaeon]